MIGLFQNMLAPVLLRARMEARKAAFISAAGLLLMGALSLAGAAGLIVVSARFGVVIGLLGGAGLLLLLALFVYLLGRRSPGAAATPAQVHHEALHEAAPAASLTAAAGAPGTYAASPMTPTPPATGLPASGLLAKALPPGIGASLPTGSEAAIAGLAARQLARRPVPTLVAAVGVGAVLGFLKFKEARSEAALQADADGDSEAAAAGAAVGASPIDHAAQDPLTRSPKSRRARYRSAARSAAAERRRRSI